MSPLPALLGLAMLLAVPSALRAADAAEALTWPGCVATAAARNPELASASQSVASARASRQGSVAGLLPQISIGNSYSQGGSNLLGTSSPVWLAEGTLSANILDVGQWAAVRTGSASILQAMANRNAASANLRFALRKAFDELLFAQQGIEVSQSILEMRRKSAQMVTLRYQSGRESKGNMLRSNAQALQAREDAAQSRRDLLTAQMTLVRELGVEEFAAVSASGKLEATAPPELPANLATLAGIRPDVAVQQAAVGIARAGLDSAEKGWWPTLSFSYGRQRSGAREFPSDRDSWSLSGGVNFSLLGGGFGTTYFATEAARRNLERSQQDLRSARAQAVLALASAWSAFAGAAGQVRVQEALLAAARQRNGEADVRYASGLLTYDQWEIIASDRIGEERLVLQAQLHAATAEAAWDQALGRTLEE